MVAATGYSIFVFSLFTAFASVVTLAMSSRWRALRAPAVRMLVIFSVTAVSGTYVWLQAGPEIDYRMQTNEQPTLIFPAPTELDA